jgi:hypothetical protein
MEATKRRHTVTTRRQVLFSIIISVSHLALRTSAYTTQSSVHPCDTLSQTKMKIPHIIEPSYSPSSTKRLSRGRYDLGLGQNLPVLSAATKSKQPTPPQDVLDAVKFLVEHQAVMEYPSPHRNQQLRGEQERYSDVSAIANTASPSDSVAKAKRLPFVQPKRLSPDLIDIQASRDGCGEVSDFNGRESGRHPIATVTTQARTSAALELNTAWVEMLIHEQLQAMEAAVPQAA